MEGETGFMFSGKTAALIFVPFYGGTCHGKEWIDGLPKRNYTSTGQGSNYQIRLAQR